jgi:hypothetical protein
MQGGPLFHVDRRENGLGVGAVSTDEIIIRGSACLAGARR